MTTEITEIKLPDKVIVLNPSQRDMLNMILNPDGTIKMNDLREFSMFGAVRGGKSFLFQMIGWLLCVKYPRIRCLWIRDTYDQLKDSVIKQFCDDFGKYGLFEYQTSKRKAIFKNGSEILFRAFDQDGLGILSSEYDLIAMCQAEDIAEQWFLLALSRLSGRRLPKPIMFTEGNPASTWPKRRYKDALPEELKKRNIHFLELTIEENRKNLPKDFIEFLKNNYPDSWINRYLYGGWEQIDEMVFSEFRETIHLEDPSLPPENAKTRMGLDYGWRNPTALLWGYLDYDSNLHIFDEWGGSMMTVDEIAKHARRHGRHLIVADYSIKRADRDGRSLWSDLQRHGLRLLESNKQELENITLINMLMKQKRIFISRNCVNLIRELRNYKWKPQRIGEEKNFAEETIDKDNHFCFVAGTKVQTKDGLVGIEHIKIGHEVLTPLGYKPVLRTSSTTRFAYHFYGPISINCTPDHPVAYGNKLVPIDTILYADRIYKCVTLSLMSRSIVSMAYIGLRSVAVLKAVKDSMLLYGNTIMGKYLKGLKSITLTTIAQIMIFQTYRLLKKLNIEKFMEGYVLKIKEITWRGLDPLQKNGTPVKKEEDGIANMGRSAGLTDLISYISALCAGLSLKQELQEREFVRAIVLQLLAVEVGLMTFLSSALSVAKNLLRISMLQKKPAHIPVRDTLLKTPLGKATVYNLTVEGGLFYADSILVSNCDALLYLVASLEELKSIDPSKLIPKNSLTAQVVMIDNPDHVWDERG